MLPLLVLVIIIYGSKKKVDLYTTFLLGVKDSFKMILTLFPNFLAMIFGINLFVNSGFLTSILNLFSPLFHLINLPIDILPLAIIRPISGTASLAYLNTIFETHGPDSFLGILGSIMQGSTDTTFYVITLYFSSVGIKKIRYSLAGGLFADIVGIVSSIIVAKCFF